MVASVPIQRSATVALSLQETLWPLLEATASNLANSTTSGFKRVFTETVEAKQTSSKGEEISYVHLTSINHDFSPGSLRQSGNTYDLAISGDGFFQVTGGKLTQNSNFNLSIDGRILAPNGDALMNDGGGEITIPADSKHITISEDGSISNQNGIIGKVGVFTVADKKTLTYGKDGYFIPQDQPEVATNVSVLQGFVMESNVNPIEETIRLIEIQRRYEQAEKILKESYELATDVVNVSSRSAV